VHIGYIFNINTLSTLLGITASQKLMFGRFQWTSSYCNLLKSWSVENI